MKIEQIGRVVIGDDVEVGANTTIDRGALGDTTIGHGVRLDNLVHIAHNVSIGEHTAIAAKTGIAGSAKIGRYVKISGMASIVGHIQIGDHATIGPLSYVTKDVPANQHLSGGVLAMEHRSWRKAAARFRGLDQLAKRVLDLEKLIKK